MASLLPLTSFDQPARRFRKNTDENHSRDRQDNLEGEREPPGNGVILDEEETQIDPKRDSHTHADENAIRHDVGAALVCW